MPLQPSGRKRSLPRLTVLTSVSSFLADASRGRCQCATLGGRALAFERPVGSETARLFGALGRVAHAARARGGAGACRAGHDKIAVLDRQGIAGVGHPRVEPGAADATAVGTGV